MKELVLERHNLFETTKSNDLSNTPLIERRFSWQELLLREAKIDKGINLLRALKIFVSFSVKPFY